MTIAIVATAGESLLKFRGPLIREWVKRGHDVWCISIEDSSIMSEQIATLGAKYYQVSGSRVGISIFGCINMTKKYIKAFTFIKPDMCFLYMSKPIAFGGIAAIITKIKKIVVFQTGLEIAFYSKGIKNLFIRETLKKMYRFVQKKCDTVIFMCREDMYKMIQWHMVDKKQTLYVDGSGVDMQKFNKMTLPKEPIVLMVARLVWSKGIREYIQAAKEVKKTYPNCKFLLVGGLDTNSESLNEEELNKLVHDGIIEYMGYQNDVRPFIKKCSIFILPSYHEGKGTAILEAQACGRPIITTTAPGCGETVINGYNGLLVPPKDSIQLSNAIIKLVSDAKLRENMANNAYEFCKKTFDSKIIVENICTRLHI